MKPLNRLVIFTLILLVLTPLVIAEPEEEECGIRHLAECLPEKLYQYLLLIINSPIIPMLLIIQRLFTADISIQIFQHLWNVVRYLLSFFYIFFFLYIGYIFLVSNANPLSRSQAKEMLKDTFIMLILINGSYLIYEMVLYLNSTVNTALITMINPEFFLITVDNIVNIGLELLFALFYGLTLFWTMIMLTLRYIIVSFGVVLFPIGIFLFFIPPLKSYGRFILTALGIFIFITLFHLLIIIASSSLLEIQLFADMKILVVITCFLIINYTIWLAVKFALKKSTSFSIKDDINSAVKYITLSI